MLRRSLVPTVLTGMFLLLPMGAAATNGLACGDVVIQDVTLTHDLTNCPGDGLVAGASGITINLGGHTIDGDETGGSLVGGAGVRIGPGITGVTLLNGTITEFSQGVQLDFTTLNTITKLYVNGNVRGIDLANSWDNVIEKNKVTTSALDGIRVNGVVSDGNLVRQNDVSSSTFGITVSDYADDNVVDRNSVVGGVFGISVFVNANAVKITKNTVSGNAGPGIQIQSFSDMALVSRNRVSGNAVGIVVEDLVSDSDVSRNVVELNAADGILITGHDGSIERNDVFENGGYGIRLTASSSNNTVRFNDLIGNGSGPLLDSGTGNVVIN